MSKLDELKKYKRFNKKMILRRIATFNTRLARYADELSSGSLSKFNNARRRLSQGTRLAKAVSIIRSSAERKAIQYLDSIMEDYILAKIAVSSIPESNDAFIKLCKKINNIITFHVSRSFREKSDALQQAQMGLLTAASKFDPTSGKTRAQFSSYAGIWIRRFTQVRTIPECPPGFILSSGKIVRTGRFNFFDETLPNILFKSDIYDDQASANNIRYDVRRALANLDRNTRNITIDYLMKNFSIEDVCNKYNIKPAEVKVIIKKSKQKLSELLVNYHEPLARTNIPY